MPTLAAAGTLSALCLSSYLCGVPERFFKDPHSDELVVVLVNSSSEEQQVDILVDGELAGSGWLGYLTDRHHNLAYHEMLAGEPIRIPARSILTLKK